MVNLGVNSRNRVLVIESKPRPHQSASMVWCLVPCFQCERALDYSWLRPFLTVLQRLTDDQNWLWMSAANIQPSERRTRVSLKEHEIKTLVYSMTVMMSYCCSYLLYFVVVLLCLHLDSESLSAVLVVMKKRVKASIGSALWSCLRSDDVVVVVVGEQTSRYWFDAMSPSLNRHFLIPRLTDVPVLVTDLPSLAALPINTFTQLVYSTHTQKEIIENRERHNL